MRCLSQPIFPIHSMLAHDDDDKEMSSGWLRMFLSVCVQIRSHSRLCIVHVSIDMRFLTSKPSALLPFITLLFIVVVVVSIIIIIDFYYENENFTLANNTSVKIIMINEKQNRKKPSSQSEHTHTFYVDVFFVRIHPDTGVHKKLWNIYY